MSAFIARPATDEKLPDVIIGMEIFGVNDHMKDVTNRVAELGYIAIAVDFYHRTEPDLELPYDTGGRNKGMELMHQLSRAEVKNDVDATMNFLKLAQDSSDKIGFIGFSIGGHIGYFAATQLNIKATACFYAGWLTNSDIQLSSPKPTITLTKGISEHGGHLVYFVGQQDNLVTEEQIKMIETTLDKSNVKHEVIVYPNTKHGFFCDQRPGTFNQTSRDDSWKRIQILLEDELK